MGIFVHAATAPCEHAIKFGYWATDPVEFEHHYVCQTHPLPRRKQPVTA